MRLIVRVEIVSTREYIESFFENNTLKVYFFLNLIFSIKREFKGGNVKF